MRSPYYYKFFIGFLAITCIMIFGSIYAARIPQQQEMGGKWVTHTHEVLNALETLGQSIADVQTGQCSYLLTGQVAYLAPYTAAVEHISNDLEHIQMLTSDNQRQQSRLIALRTSITAGLSDFTQIIRTRTQDNTEQSFKNLFSAHDREAMELIRNGIEEMRKEEKELLQLRSNEWHHAALHTRDTFLASALLFYVLVCALYAMLYRESERRKLLVEHEKNNVLMEQQESARLLQIVSIHHELAGYHHDLQTAMRIITECTQSMTQAEGAIVEIIEEGEMVYRAVSGTATSFLGMRIKAQGSLSGLCLQENQVLKCDDAMQDDRVDKQACERIGLRSMVVVPLRHNGEAVGVLKVMSAQVATFNAQDIATLELMASVLSAVVSDAMSTDIIRETNKKLTDVNHELVLQKKELEKLNNHLEAFATTDGLTGLKNHRMFQEQLAKEYDRASRYKVTFSLVLLDVDNFKAFNDTFGHPAGDAVFKQVAQLLQGIARTSDFVARYGGEEFVVILPEISQEGALYIAERLRKAIEGASWPQRTVTASFGVCTFNENIASAADILEDADRALYASKHQGRNRVTAA